MDYDTYLANLRGRSGEVVRYVERAYRDFHKGRQQGWDVALFVGSSLGVHRVILVVAENPGHIIISTLGDPEARDMLYLPVEQCCFMFRHYKLKVDEERVVVGFTPQPEPRE